MKHSAVPRLDEHLVAPVMASPFPDGAAALSLNLDETVRLHKRREAVRNYQTPKWTANHVDPVSGDRPQFPMVNHANIVFIGPVGTGKSSLIGSLCRSVSGLERFPASIQLTLNHPDDDRHGSITWLETSGNASGTILYQDTRGDQEYDVTERSIHEYSFRGMYRDGATLEPKASSFLSKDWWVSRRFFWERTLNEIPHCVAFVFDGSSHPFLDEERLEFFQSVFSDCRRMDYEPVIIVTCLDLIYQDALANGRNFEVEVQHKKDQVLQAFEDLNLPRQSIYFVTNFHEGKRGVRVWNQGDRGFDVVTKKMVDLARDLLTVADRFIERKYTSYSRCCLL